MEKFIAITLGLIFLGGPLCLSDAAAGAKTRIVKGGGVEVRVPDNFPPEIIGGDKRDGYIKLDVRGQQGMCDDFFEIHWSNKELNYQDILSKEGYTFLFETPLEGLKAKVSGAKADFAEVVMRIKYPDGEVKEQNFLLASFYCKKTRRHFLALAFLNTLPHLEFVNVLKTLKCS